MWSKLSKNGILRGPMQLYCLVCECLIGNVDKIDKHIEDHDHENRLGMYPHLKKYTNDRIRKIKAVYHCEFCSVILDTARKVNAHISSREHINNRGLQQLTVGHDSGVVALNEVLISEDAWHAIGDNCCSLCNEEDVDSEHKHSPNHLLKFINSKIEFLVNGLYRKIDESTFQCLTCNILFEVDMINNHFYSEDHEVVFTKCKIQDNNSNGKIIPVKGNNKGSTEEIKKYAKDHKITYNLGHRTAYCTVCEIRMPASLLSLKEHVTGIIHVNKLKSTTPQLKTIPFCVYRNEVISIQNGSCHDSVINMKICIPLESLLLFTKKSESEFRCLLCDQNFNKEDNKDHEHSAMLSVVPFVTTFDNEFLREIRPGVYHCGFCNELVNNWGDVPSHLQSAHHKLKKETCQNKLSIYLSEKKKEIESN